MMKTIACIIFLLAGVVPAIKAQSFEFDYSHVGYRQSDVSIPDAKVVVKVDCRKGDQSRRIQKAIDYVSRQKIDKATGVRGAVLLEQGIYELSEALHINASGVVLRGVGRDKTVLLKKGVDRGAVVYLEGREGIVLQDTLNVTSSALLGATTLQVDGQIAAGEHVMVWRPSTKEWIQKMKCGDFGAGKDLGYWGWHPGEIDVWWTRRVVASGQGSITLDQPLTMALNKDMAQTKVIRIREDRRIENSGVENLTVMSDYDHSNDMDENHAWDGVYVDRAHDCWVRMVNFQHLAGSAVVVQRSASQLTVEDCMSLQPVSELGGYRRRTFLCMGERCLFQRLYSEHGMHDFAAGMNAAGPNVFSQCDSWESEGYSGAVGPWATGLLFDDVNIDGNDIKLCNLGLEGYGTGWNTANSVAWQCTASGIFLDSLPDGSANRAYGCWAQFNGTGKYFDCNNHVKPWSAFAAQLAKRNANAAGICRVLERRMGTVSNNPTYEEAAAVAQAAHAPRITMRMWIADSARFVASVSAKGAVNVDDVKEQKTADAKEHTLEIVQGRLLFDGGLLTGGRQNAPWWNGRVRYSAMVKAADGVTRFVPGMEGQGATVRIDSVASHFRKNGVVWFNQNYGLWYDRRRDDHERIRRSNADVWAPFYEQTFARSGKGKAWDGLSKYDLEKLNPWYIHRVGQLAQKGAGNGLVVVNQHYFQHNILEAGAHWVDCPWRPVNNVNGTVFPEPVPFAGDKRVWVADYFYDIDNDVMRRLHRQYIMNMLDAFADNGNVVHSIGEEYTGPYHFTKFWLETIAEWEHKTGRKAKVALSCNKDVQDSILHDAALSKVVDIIDIEQWQYTAQGVYAPEGGKNLAPRQYKRRLKPGKPGFQEVYRAVNEYRKAYPDKAVVYFADNYTSMGWAVLMAGGSCPNVKVADETFLKSVAAMKPSGAMGGVYMMQNQQHEALVYIDADNKSAALNLPKGTYSVVKINGKTGEMTKMKNISMGDGDFQLNGGGIFWLRPSL